VFGGEYPGGALLYSDTGRMDPKGAQAVLDVFSQSVPEVANAKIDLSKTYTNRFVEQALTTTGMLSR
jgi:NitT/TauT family transport system substrate-binding protein